MSPYFFIFFSPLLIYFYKNLNNYLFKFLLSIHFIIVILFIGTRFQIGGDWETYYNIFHSFQSKSFQQIVETKNDFMFKLLNYIIYNMNFKIYILNTLTACICVFCLYKYSKKQFDPILLSIVAIPYIIFVVVMGYNRQGIALCILILSINYFDQKKHFKFIILVLTASLFHLTALCFTLFYLLILPFKNKYMNLIIFIPILFIFLFVFYAFLNTEYFSSKYYFYVADGNYFASTGVYYRLILNVIPAIIFLIYYKNFKISNNLKYLYLIFSTLSIVSLFFAIYATTFIDRILIYFYPIQLFVYSNYYAYFPIKYSKVFISIIFLIYAVVLYIYFEYGLYSKLWLPYQSYIFK